MHVFLSFDENTVMMDLIVMCPSLMQHRLWPLRLFEDAVFQAWAEREIPMP